RQGELGEECDSNMGNKACIDSYAECVSQGDVPRCWCRFGYVEENGKCKKRESDILENLWDQLGTADPLGLLGNLTDTIEDQDELTGSDIGDLVDFLDPLFDKFLDMLGNYSDPLNKSQDFLTNFTRTMDEVLISFKGWLEITPEATTTLVIEIGTRKKDNLTGPVVFPSSVSDTYLSLPSSFQDNIDDDYYSYVGVVYHVQDLNELLPGHENSFGEHKVANSKLLSFSLGINETVYLTDPATLIFRNARSPQSPWYKDIWRNLHEGEKPSFLRQTHKCAFWNFNETGYWDDEGLQEVSSDDDDTICRTKHFTNFVVLMSVHGYVVSPFFYSP
ncbi:unnamed protein product, partial [Darwinula stevensoni]